MRYRFDDCEFDTDAIRLVVAGDDVPVQPQVADVLRVLIEERTRVVSKEELLDRVWGHTFVTESALTSRVKSARQAIGDDGKEQRLIRTVHGRGYQFIGTLRDQVDDGQTHEARSSVRATRSSAARLPAYGSALVGRNEELAQLRQLLAETSLVTVVGPGGVGKTRLAVACAASFDDRDVVFGDLTTIHDHTLVVDQIATAMGLHAAGPDAADAIAEYVGERPTLLVVDNVEHVIDAGPSIGELACDVPGLQVLATSRERLRVDGERTFTLDPLPTGPLPGRPDDDPAAVELFLRTARAVAPDLDVGRYRKTIEHICATVDGLPLAIELVAGQTRTLPPDMLAARLDDRLRSMSGGRRDAPERHRTMSATIDWSLRLLDRDELHLFTRLGAFVGDVPLSLIEAVCTDDELPAPLEVLTRLVDKSLVRVRRDPSGDTRFGMLELLRTRAAELLAESAEATEITRRHVRAVSAAADRIELERWGPLAGSWADLLTLLLPEFRRAHDMATALGEWESAGLLVASYGHFWHREGGLPEGGRRIDDVLEHADELSDATRGRVMLAAGLLAWDVGDMREARELWLAATELLEASPFRSHLAYSLAATGMTTIGEAELRSWAIELLDQALPIAEAGDPAGLADVLNVRGEFFRAVGDDEAAQQAYSRALRVAADAGNTSIEAVALANLAYVECHAGRFVEARRLSRAALHHCVRMRRRLMAAWTVGELAIPAHGLGQHELAARLCGAADRAIEILKGGRYPADLDEDERLVASLVETLGREEFDRLVGEGRTLTLDEAIGLALDDFVDVADRRRSVPDASV